MKNNGARPLLVLSALEDELLSFFPKIEQLERIEGLDRVWCKGVVNGVACVVGHAGVGVKNAGHAAEWAIERFAPSAVLLAGYSGGLSGEIRRGDVVASCAELVGLLGDGARLGGIVCVPKVLETEDEKRGWAARTGALVCEMESDGVSSACLKANVPFYHIRIVSDALGDDFPEVPLTKAFDFTTGRTTLWPLILYVIFHPGMIAPLMELSKMITPVREKLGKVLFAVVPKISTLKK